MLELQNSTTFSAGLHLQPLTIKVPAHLQLSSERYYGRLANGQLDSELQNQPWYLPLQDGTFQ